MSYFISINDKISDGSMKKLSNMKNIIKRAYTAMIISATFTIILMIISSIYAFKNLGNSKAIEIIIFICIIATVVSIYVYLMIQKKYKISFKTDVVPHMLKQVATNINYIPFGHVNEELVKMSDLNFSFDTLTGEDYIIMDRNIGDYKYVLELSEISTSFKDKNLNMVEQKIKGSFNGIFVHAKTSWTYPGELKIISSYNKLDELGKTFSKKEQEVLLESESFMKEYKVYATEQIEVRRILTPVNMEKIQEIVKELNIKPEISIKGNDIYMKLEYTEFLDFYTRNDIISENKLNKDYIVLKYIIELFDSLVSKVEKIVVE